MSLLIQFRYSVTFISPISKSLQLSPHAAQRNCLENLILVDTILRTLPSEAAVLHTSKPVPSQHSIIFVGKEYTYGAAASLISPVLTPTIPVSSASATLYALWISLL